MPNAFELPIRAVLIKIRDIRVAKSYSQFYLSVKLCISQNAYSKIELGQTKLTLERLYQVALILGVSVNDLLT